MPRLNRPAKLYKGKRFWCFCQYCRGQKHVSKRTIRRHIAWDEMTLLIRTHVSPESRQEIGAALEANRRSKEEVKFDRNGEPLEDNNEHQRPSTTLASATSQSPSGSPQLEHDIPPSNSDDQVSPERKAI